MLQFSSLQETTAVRGKMEGIVEKEKALLTSNRISVLGTVCLEVAFTGNKSGSEGDHRKFPSGIFVGYTVR